MAKNKGNNQIDDLDMDSGLDFDLPEFGGEKVKDDRKPVTKVAMKAAEGFSEAILSAGMARKFVDHALPNEYGQTFRTADTVVGSMRDVYDQSVKELKPALKELGRFTRRVLPTIEPVLPKRFTAKLKDWTEPNAAEASRLSEEQLRDMQIKSQTAEIWKLTEQANQDREQRESIKDHIKDTMDQRRHRDNADQLNNILNVLKNTDSYNREIDAKYKQKSLELQYRHYFVAVDALKEMTRINAITQTNLEAISKNTGLPDFLKLRGTERAKEMMRNSMISGVQDGLFGKRRDFIPNVIGNLKKEVLGRMKDKVGQFRDGMSSADSMLDAKDMMGDFGVSGADMAANMGGGIAAEALTTRAGKYVGKYLKKHDGVKRVANKLGYWQENAPQILKEYAEGYKHDNLPLVGGLVRLGKDAINNTSLSINGGLNKETIETLSGGDEFNRRTNKSITDVIPGFLSRIYQELQMIRTGDNTIEAMSYDHFDNKFEKHSEVKSKIRKTISNDYERDSSKRQGNQFADLIDKDKELTPEERERFIEMLTKMNMRGVLGDEEKMTDSMNFEGVSYEDSDKFAGIMKKYFKDDPLLDKKRAFSKGYNNLGGGFRDQRGYIQNMANLGYGDHLRDMGLITDDGSSIKLDSVRDLQQFNRDGKSSLNPSDQRMASFLHGNNGFVGPAQQTPQMASPAPSPTPPKPDTESKQNNMMEELTKVMSDLSKTIKEKQATEKDATGEGILKNTNEMIALLKATLNVKIVDGNVTINGFGDGKVGGKGKEYQDGFMGLMNHLFDSGKKGLGSAVSLGKTAGGKLWDAGNIAGGKLMNAGIWGVGKLKDMGGKLLDKLEKIQDIYIKGQILPALEKAKIESGAYLDVATGKIIRTLKDVTGDVIDITDDNKVVFRKENLQDAYVRLKTGAMAKATNLFGKVKKAVTDAGSFAFSMSKSFYGQIYDNAKLLYNKVVHRPQDVYVKGKKEPALLAMVMKAGGYVSQITGKPIRSPLDIDGPVMDMSDKSNPVIVLSTEDLKLGISDVNGKEFKTIKRMALDAALKVKDFVMEQAGKAWDKTKKLGSALKNKVFGQADPNDPNTGLRVNILSNNSFGTTKTTNNILIQIRDMLNQRMSGEPTTFQDPSTMSTPLSGGLAGIKNTMKKAVTGLYGKAKEKVGGIFGRFQKKDGIQISGMSKMLGYLGTLSKNFKGTKTDDKPRANSYQEWLQSHMKGGSKAGTSGGKDGNQPKDYTGAKSFAEVATEKAKAAWDTTRDTVSSAKDTYDTWKDARAAKKAAQTTGTISKGVGGAADAVGTVAKGGSKWGKIAGLGGKLLGGAGAALGAYEAYQDVKEGNYGSAAVNGGLTALSLGASGLLPSMATIGTVGSAIGGGVMAAGSALGTGLLALGGGIVSLLSSPVVLTGLAVAAAGYGAYKLYKYVTSEKDTPYRRLRMAQYGLLVDDKDHIGSINSLEDKLKDKVSFKDGKADIDIKSEDLPKLMEAFDVDKDNKKQVSAWTEWFNNRFKQVYLQHLGCWNAIDPKMSFKDFDKLESDKKLKLYNGVKLDSGPFNVSTSPWTDLPKLKAGYTEVKDAFDKGLVEINKEKDEKDKEKKEDKATAPGDSKASAVVGATGAAAAASDMMTAAKDGIDSDTPPSVPEQAIPMDDDMLRSAQQYNDLTTLVGGDIGGVAITGNRLDELTSIRMKAHGLQDMVIDKVKNLLTLEQAVSKGLEATPDGKMSWNGSPKSMFDRYGAAFGVSSSEKAADWITWFRSRFMPVYLAYASAVFRSTGKKDIAQAVITMAAIDQIDVGIAIYGARTLYEGSDITVWKMPITPWPGYELNSTVSTTDGNMDSLKEKAKNIKLNESVSSKTNATSDKNKEADTKSVGASANGGSTAGKADDASKSGFFGKVGGALSSAYDSVKNFFTGGDKKPDGKASTPPTGSNTTAAGMPSGAPTGGATGFGGGSTVDMSLNGTGGEYTKLPDATGKGYQGFKDMINGAGKMVGVDSNLMATMVAAESGFNPGVKAGSSSASGLMQFISDTWKAMVKKYGPKYGIPPGTSPFDAKANLLMGAEYIKENIQSMQKYLKRKVTDTDVYMGHFMGTGGAKQFLTADPSTIGATMFPAAAAANPTIYYDKGRPKTLAEIYEHFSWLLKKRSKDNGIPLGTGGGDILLPADGKPASNTAATPSSETAPIGTVPTTGPTGISASPLPSPGATTPTTTATPSATPPVAATTAPSSTPPANATPSGTPSATAKAAEPTAATPFGNIPVSTTSPSAGSTNTLSSGNTFASLSNKPAADALQKQMQTTQASQSDNVFATMSKTLTDSLDYHRLSSNTLLKIVEILGQNSANSNKGNNSPDSLKQNISTMPAPKDISQKENLTPMEARNNKDNDWRANTVDNINSAPRDPKRVPVSMSKYEAKV